jgi:hypothetical protein
MGGWHVIVSGPEMIGDFRQATDEEMSAPEAAEEVYIPLQAVPTCRPISLQLFHTTYTLGREMLSQAYQSRVIGGILTRNIKSHFPEIHEEVVLAFADQIPPSKGPFWVRYRQP